MVKTERSFLDQIFQAASIALTHERVDLSVVLIASQCLIQLSHKLSDREFDSKHLEPNFLRLIRLLTETSEESMIIPIECICSMSRLNREKAIIVPMKAAKLVIDIYSMHYNHPVLGSKILELIRIWCEDARSSKMMLDLFVPFAIHVFDEFFKSLKNPDKKAFEDVRNTVMTEHAGGNIEFKTSLDMLPVSLLK